MNIFQILSNGYLGQVVQVPENTKGIPIGYTRTPPPVIPPGQYAVWRGNGWGLTPTSPLPRTSYTDISVIQSQVQENLDTFARTRNYDSILSACTYASSAIEQFRTEGLRCVELRDRTWSTFFQIVAAADEGARPPVMSYGDIEAELPELVW